MSDDLFSLPSGSESLDDPSSQQIESSGVSSSSPPAAPARPHLPQAKRSSAATANVSYVCQRCSKVYKRKYHYDKHVIAHDISDVTPRKPTEQEFVIVIDDLMVHVLSSLLNEPDLGQSSSIKKEFVTCILQKQSVDLMWHAFQTKLAEPLLKCLMKPSKLLPQNRYAEALKKLNFYLGDKHNINELVEHLKKVSPNLFSSPDVDFIARRLVFRMSYLLLDQIQIFIAKEMRKGTTSEGLDQSKEISDDERSEFYSVLSSLLRSLYLKGYKRQKTSKMFRSLCKCLKEKFVYMSDCEEPITSRQFTDKHLWTPVHEPSVNDVQQKILIHSEVLDFFLFVEQSLVQENNVFPSLSDIMNKIYCNMEAMSAWCTLTQSYFGDENAVYVMKVMVSAFRELSIRLEMDRMNRTQKDQTNLALRTNLKRD